MKQIHEEAKELLEIIESHHYQAFFVGGCVRDSLLQKDIKDVDIATSATPNQIMEIFPSVIPVGIEHGTVIVRHRGMSYEVTTFRSETGYSDQRHPDEVIFITDIKEDLARRDFTINAMAMDRNAHLIDPFFGQEDLHAQLIRTVGIPEERFQEDSLRIIRALRFSSQLGFGIEEATLEQMNKLKYQLEDVSVERITVEMTKFFQGDDIELGLQYLRQTNITNHLPIFKNDKGLISSLREIKGSFHRFAEVMAYFHLMNENYTLDMWTKAWKCSNKEKTIAQKLVNGIKYLQQHSLDNWLVYQIDKEHMAMFVHLVNCVMPEIKVTSQQLIQWKKNLPLHSRNELCINGTFIANLYPNHKKGAWIGTTLKEIEYKIVMGEMNNDKSDIKEWIQCHPPVKN